MGRVVGIDLGTTNSVVAVMEGGKPVVIANAEGTRTTPSVVGFSKDGERLVGQLARRQAVLDPQNTFYGVKRYIGRQYAELSNDSKRVPYTIRRDEVGNIKLKCPRLQRDFAPEEIAAIVLRKLADEAGKYLGEPVTGAVITVPAYFNDSQRQATRDAGRIAGLEVKRILNEPTAASLAYGLDRRSNQTILVFDLGGGTFDVSVLEIGDGVFEVKSTSGDTQLGGTDFDRRIVDWLAEQFLEQEGVDLRRDRQALQRITEAAEKAKIELSGVNVTEINLPFITATDEGPKHLETRLTRSKFEELSSDLLSRLRGPIKQALRDAGMDSRDIDEVVLVGGSSRIPAVQELVRSYIDREPNQNVNPDEVVAVGAAIQAGILDGEIKDILLLDVTPISLGLETIGGVMKKLLPRNTTIPVRRSDIFSTGEDNQTMVEVHVLQGEREMAAGNKSLGRFKLAGIPPAPRGIPQVQVSFDIDANGILQVTAMDRTTGREQSITIQGASTLSEDEVQRMIREAEENAEVDRQKREKVQKRNDAESLILKAERQLREATLDYGMGFVRSYRNRIDPAIASLKEALSQNNERAIDRAKADLEDAVYDLTREIYQRVQEEKEKDSLLGAIKSFFTDEDDDYYDYRDDYYGNRYGGGGYGSSGYGTSGYGAGGYDLGVGGYGSGSGGTRRETYSDRSSQSSSSYNRDNYSRDSYDRDSYSSGSTNRERRDSDSKDPYSRDSYNQSPRRSDSDRSRSTQDDWGKPSSRSQDDWGTPSSRSQDDWSNPRTRDTDRNTPSRRRNDDWGGSETPSYDSRKRQQPGDEWGATNRYGDRYDSGASGASEGLRGGRNRYDDDTSASRDRRSGRRKPEKPDLYRDNWDDDDDWL
ncbi:MAG TPA: molecular chaperone DnaK [Leptolyngbyaceae cyanobacterium M33_DOE_097]|uniref:Chaperone protein DnaK n=1 Tax=Oscillatoriales cyanobacterium SpSt-418 TaxID=2282169 RepID=A0A7C3KHH5_9CYAN|nr:molecular chaperone DnaK [Leptolyngbyaceae cyanobacterium M33_DOE_097]